MSWIALTRRDNWFIQIRCSCESAVAAARDAFFPRKIHGSNPSETLTESIFRSFYGSKTFLEKSAIPKSCGFKSKNGTSREGYPDFYKNAGEYDIIVEAKAIQHRDAEKDILFYIKENKIRKDIIGIALSGQNENELHGVMAGQKNGLQKVYL